MGVGVGVGFVDDVGFGLGEGDVVDEAGLSVGFGEDV